MIMAMSEYEEEISVLHEPYNRNLTVFIYWGIIIIACCHKRTSGCSPEIGSTKVLQSSANRKHVHPINRPIDIFHVFARLKAEQEEKN